ncbi:unnamed protein product [Pelagomonas calceolata]|uniref:MalT-like TPR region domain-containing protein n=1 Tax=Pelagomonas calceolata TaxID=35677 RepID=A0A8J2SU21_9STRA|nr:unnamed protein product [Pelagomonas calceolata]
MNLLGSGLHLAKHHEDALSVQEAQLATMRRLGESEGNILAVQTNLSCSYRMLGRDEEALSMRRDIYSGRLKLDGEQNERTLIAAKNYATSLKDLSRFEEAKALLRKEIPVTRRVLGESNDLTLKMRWVYAETLVKDPAATFDDLHEAVTTLEDAGRTARRVLGGAHPLTVEIERGLQKSRAVLRARETQPSASA